MIAGFQNFFKAMDRYLTQKIKSSEETLRSVFKLEGFRGMQKEIIEYCMDKADCLVVIPTGGGKSLIYQLPAVMSEGVTIVISPLLALIVF